MASLTQLYVHCVWATWDRLPLITPLIEPRLYAALATTCNQLECTPLAIGGVADHVHLLAEFYSTITIAQLVGQMKGSSAHLVTHILEPGSFFKWQGSYGAFTLSKRSLPSVRAYILDQKVRHLNGNLLNEFEIPS